MTVTINSQSLLCICLLAFLPLPLCLSLSCETKHPPNQVKDDFNTIVKTQLANTIERVNASLQNVSCQELRHNLPNCINDKENIVKTLCILAYRMPNLGISHTEELTRSVRISIGCVCNVTAKRPKTAARQRGRKRLCKAEKILSSIKRCYEVLNDHNDR